MSEKIPIMDDQDIERELLKAIEKQKAMIRVALAYLHAEQAELAKRVLEEALR